MKYARLAIVILLILAALGAWVTWSREKERSAELLRRQRALAPRPNVSDADFLSTLYPTKDPSVFTVGVKKVNPKSDKQFSALFISMALVLTDKNGKVYGAAGFGAGKYFEEVGDFHWPKNPTTDSAMSCLRVVKSNLHPGTYMVTPFVRITEVGKHVLRGGPYADGGVSVPAANSVAITIK